jgi:type II secretory pathway component PulM
MWLQLHCAVLQLLLLLARLLLLLLLTALLSCQQPAHGCQHGQALLRQQQQCRCRTRAYQVEAAAASPAASAAAAAAELHEVMRDPVQRLCLLLLGMRCCSW